MTSTTATKRRPALGRRSIVFPPQVSESLREAAKRKGISIQEEVNHRLLVYQVQQDQIESMVKEQIHA